MDSQCQHLFKYRFRRKTTDICLDERSIELGTILSTVDVYTDHLTGIKYTWNNQTNSWDTDGSEPIETEEDLTKERKPVASVIPPTTQPGKKKTAEGLFLSRILVQWLEFLISLFESIFNRCLHRKGCLYINNGVF